MNDARPAGAVYLDARKKAAQRGADAALYACIDNNYGLFPEPHFATLGYGRAWSQGQRRFVVTNSRLAFYNHRKIHSTLGYMSLMQFEKSGHAAHLMKAA